MTTNILRFNGSVEIDQVTADKLAMQKDYTATIVGEIRATIDCATDGEDGKRIFRLRVSEVKEITG